MVSDPSEKEAAVGWLHVHLPIEESNPRLSIGGAARGQSLGSAPPGNRTPGLERRLLLTILGCGVGHCP